MAKNLLIVESPAKAKTINKYLGKDFHVLASYGHVRDLVPKEGAVDTDHGFAMNYAVIEKNEKHVDAIAKAAAKADSLYLATDLDREGEAISWHISEILRERNLLKGKALHRVVFSEITPHAILDAVANPRALSLDLVNAQQARRALDYLVGFNLSPVLWRKVQRGLSAGRVQSPALRMIVEREEEIEAFKAQEYWSIEADCAHPDLRFSARLTKLRGKKFEQFDLTNERDAHAARTFLLKSAQGRLVVSEVQSKERKRRPSPPFTTSTLQQEAARKLGFSASHTMRVAQSLYEDGLITYMRTDGVDMAPEAVSAARKAIASRYDAGFVPDKPRQYQSKIKNAQEAHEAIRPTDFDRSRAASGDHARLYELVYNRALASQMASARLERTTVELTDGPGRAVLRATGQVVLFPGFLTLYEEGRDEKAEDEEGARMPALREGDAPVKTGVEANQSFTQPPPRYSEASLVKRLEELGIGRPSTYAATLQTLKDREYVRIDKGRFVPEESGRLVTAFLERFFERYVSYDYTAELEEELDDVSGGRLDWQKLLDDFWRDFKPKAGEVMDQKPSEITQALDEFLSPWLYPPRADGSDPRVCPQCGNGRLSLRGGKFGAFVACSNYPDCKYTQKFGQGGDQAQSEGPTELGDGILLKSGRFGPYVERGDKRASIPKDVPLEDVTTEVAERLLSLPREIGPHPETGKPITASIGRYGPYLAHDGKYAKLGSTAEVFETGMNAAVSKLADAASGAGRRQGASREPIAVLGKHPNGKDVKVMAGRYGPYVSDGTIHATLPKDAKPEAVTLDEAVRLIDERAAKGPSARKGRRPARKKAK